MIVPRLVRTDPERIFIVVNNNEGAQINKDDVCAWELASASVDGVKVRQPDTSLEVSRVGIVDANIANGEYGLVQVWGYRSTSRLFQTNTSQNTGAILIASGGAAHLQSVASNSGLDRMAAFLAETVASTGATATVSAKVFVRPL